MTGRRRPGSRGRADHAPLAAGQASTTAAWCRDQLDLDSIIAAGRAVLSEYGIGVAVGTMSPGVVARIAAAGFVGSAPGADPGAMASTRLTCGDGDLTRLLALVPPAFRLAGDPMEWGSSFELGAGQAGPLFAPVVSASMMIGSAGERRALPASAIRDVEIIARQIRDLRLSAGGLWLQCSDLSHRDRIIAFATAGGRPLIADMSGPCAPRAVIAAAQAARPIDDMSGHIGPIARLTGIIAIDQMLLLPSHAIEAIVALVEAGEALVIAPTLILGANCPAAVEGALVRFAAEVMGFAALAQAIRPGTMMMAGARVAEASMRTGLPLVGTAAQMRATAGAIAIARRLGLAVAALGPATAAKTADAHAGCDTALWLSVAGAADLVIGAAGGLDLDAAVSLDKMVLDADLLAALVSSEGVRDHRTSSYPADLARTVVELGAGGNALASQETRDIARQRRPHRLANDWLYETWDAAGRPEGRERAAQLVAEMLIAPEARSAPSDGARSDAVAAAVDTALAADIAAHIGRLPAEPSRIASVAADLYSSAMRTAFGFKG